MPGTTVADIVERVRWQLASSQRWEVNTLAEFMTDSQTTLTLNYDATPGLEVGSELSIDDETMRVMAVATDGELTVLRGWGGTTAGNHDEDAVVWINPRFTTAQIMDELESEIRGLPSSLFRVVGHQFTIAAGDGVYELPATFTGMYGVLDVRRNWTDDDTSAWPRLVCRVQRGDPTAWTDVNTSGVLLRYIDVTYAGSGYIEVAMPFALTTFLLETDLVSDCGLPASLLDVVELGVRIRLLFSQEAGRSQRMGQGEARNAEEVPAMAAAQGANALRVLYNKRKEEEVARLRALYPMRLS